MNLHEKYERGCLKKKISITLSTDVLDKIDRLIGSDGSRSAFIEKVLKSHLQKLERQAIQQRDLELINANADYLNREMEDVLRYQADIFAVSGLSPMISPSLHPDPVRAVCERRRRWGFGLTPRTIGLLIVGFLWLIPGFWDGRLAYAMPAWDVLVLLAALLDGLRLPHAAQLTASRTWSNAPALDSETEIELTIENHGQMIVECRLVDDLPPALVAEPPTLRLTAFPRVPASLRYRVQPTERGDWETGWLYVRYRSGLGLAERWARAPLTQTVRVYPALRTGEEQQIFLARSRQIDLQLRRAQQRGLGRDFESLREYREGDDLRDICWTATARRGIPITRQYQTERSQPVWIVLDCGRLMRSRVAMALRS